jgi:hypothetical protein
MLRAGQRDPCFPNRLLTAAAAVVGGPVVEILGPNGPRRREAQRERGPGLRLWTLAPEEPRYVARGANPWSPGWIPSIPEPQRGGGIGGASGEPMMRQSRRPLGLWGGWGCSRSRGWRPWLHSGAPPEPGEDALKHLTPETRQQRPPRWSRRSTRKPPIAGSAQASSSRAPPPLWPRVQRAVPSRPRDRPRRPFMPPRGRFAASCATPTSGSSPPTGEPLGTGAEVPGIDVRRALRVPHHRVMQIKNVRSSRRYWKTSLTAQ